MIRRAKFPSLEGRGHGRDYLLPCHFRRVSGCNRRESLPQPLHSREGGFTLMEIVLAIGLTSVVMYLLMTAVELYMLRVDSSRGRVESAQLARTLLDQMATDIAAMRLDPPPAATGGGGGGQQAGGGNQGGQSSFGAQGQQGGAGQPRPAGSWWPDGRGALILGVDRRGSRGDAREGGGAPLADPSVIRAGFRHRFLLLS